MFGGLKDKLKKALNVFSKKVDEEAETTEEIVEEIIEKSVRKESESKTSKPKKETMF